MSKNKILLIVLSLFLIGMLLVVIEYATIKSNGLLVNPWVGKVISQPTTAPVQTPTPVTPSYNPPKEIHYSGSTNLKEELDSVNPEVLESDFQ